MRLYPLLAVTLLLPACSTAPTPTLGPPVAAAPNAPAVASVVPPEQARVQGVLMTAAGARAYPGAVATPIGGGLQLVCWLSPAKGDVSAAGSGTTVPPGRALTTGDLGAFALDDVTAISLAEENLRAGLRPADAVLTPQPNGIGVDAGDFGEAGRLALVDQWASLAAAMGGDLLVAAPAADTVLYEDGRIPGALARLSARAGAVMAQSPRPISATILRWSSHGWQSTTPAAQG